jgi:hypothetical protein
MAFSFLNPWLWLGALALAAPLWLHLRRKQEKNLHLFSAVRFLDDQPQPRQSPLRLRDILLFLLRALALLLVVAAFTWPFLRGADTFPIRESRVYILDNTLSHQAGGGTLHDRDRILSEAARAGSDIQLAVVELISTPRVLVSFGDSRETLRGRLNALQPSFQRGSYLAAFRQANALLNNSLGARKRIVFLGDNQENQWNENVSTPPFLHNVDIELPAPAAAFRPNLSLAEPRVQRVFLGDKSLVNFTAKLSHLGPAKTATVVLRANGQTIFNRPVDFEQQSPGILLQAQWEADPASWLRGEISVDGTPDDLSADNRVFFSLAPVVEGKVAVLAQSTYLRLALSPDIMKGQWAARMLDPAKLAEEVNANQDAEVLCLESSYLQSSDARKLLWRYLTNGRGVLLMVNRTTPVVTGALRELGFEVEGAVHPGPERPEKFQFVLSNHPIFHPFLSPDYGNLMAVKLFKYFRLQSTQALPLVFGEHGDGLFFQGTKLQGKLFVTAFGLDRDHTTWPIDQTFIPFLDLALQTARAEDPTPTTFEPGEVAQVQLPAGTSAREVVLRDDSRELSQAPVEQGRVQLRLPDRPGLYALSFDDSTQVQKVFSVNPSPRESQLAYVAAPGALQAWKVNYPTESSKVPTPVARISLSTILQQRWWWWMVMAGLVALLLETVLTETRATKRANV